MFLSKYALYIPSNEGEVYKESVVIANAMMIELLNYGILTETDIISRMMKMTPSEAMETAKEVLKAFTIGDVNPPLFRGWENRTSFSFGEAVVQVIAYMLQVSGNDLANQHYLQELKDNVDFKRVKVLMLVSEEDAINHFQNLLHTSQGRKQQETLQAFAKLFPVTSNIKSDEARIAVLLARGVKNIKGKPADILRFFAARKEFEQVNLPSTVLYDNMTWQERKIAYKFLSDFDDEFILEAMGFNRAAWIRFFKHTHLFQQQELLRKFSEFSACAWVSIGGKVNAVPAAIEDSVYNLIKTGVAEQTAEGALAYRTFASRYTTAIENKDFEAICELVAKRPSYLLRNIAATANAVTVENRVPFLELCRKSIKTASKEVLFSILQIDVRANYRIIDVKGDTIVSDAEYSPYLTAIQKDIELELNTRYGVEGVINYEAKLKDVVVPFLSRNSELARGTKISYSNEKYLHFFMHWIQSGGRTTDLDHSHLVIHDNGRCEMIAFYNQANAFIAQSGDLTSAPTPHGATEYSVYDLERIPASVKYIVPVINVYAGDDFKSLNEAYAGFIFNDTKQFNINQEHTRYDLSQPARMNLPFVLDVDNKEIIIIDYNSRDNNSGTAAQYGETVKKIIDVSQSMNKMTIKRFAKLLSREGNVVIDIKETPLVSSDISPADLSKLVKD